MFGARNAFLAGSASIPGAPIIGTATATGSTTATVSFTAPSSDGGSPITLYTATSSPGSITGTLAQAGSGTITVTGLTAGTTYTFTVRATNAVGQGPASAASNSITLIQSYKLYAWGFNAYGDLGIGDTTVRSSPVQVGALNTWTSITVGKGITSDGKLWAWGINNVGQLGLNTATFSYSSPVQVGALTNWLQVSGGQYTFTAAIKTNGTLWTWGPNNQGQLGLGNTTAYSSPKQVGSLTDWLYVSAGYESCGAIKTNNTLWTWGRNGNGELGLGNTTARSSPTQVGSLTNWASVRMNATATIALKTDGTIWSWGYNINGQLGINSANYYYSSPKQIGSLTNWTAISNSGYTMHAIDSSGRLYGWGRNNTGAVGNGTVNTYSSPIQIGALTNWSKVETAGIANGYTAAIKTDGTLWTWGQGSSGRLGLGNTTSYSSPKQVGSGTSWRTQPAGSGTSGIMFAFQI